MNVILGQDYYALLEISRFAPKSEIVKAYHRLKAAFDPDSLATYSLFDHDEARMIAARVEEALRVLIDDRKKEVYDRWLQARERGE
ncbi:MAG TPA: DnaJ domain-containing protein, partial [bacterium]|nr:DnaJ domain-containing protein [bacterium]